VLIPKLGPVVGEVGVPLAANAGIESFLGACCAKGDDCGCELTVLKAEDVLFVAENLANPEDPPALDPKGAAALLGLLGAVAHTDCFWPIAPAAPNPIPADVGEGFAKALGWPKAG
jgi:hypothetical protein